MEKQIDESTGLIVGSIENQAARECERLKKSADDLYAQKVAALEEEIQQKYARKVSYELEKQRIEANQKATVLEADHKASLAELRRQVTEKVYAASAEKIKAFTLSDDYAAFLENSVKAAGNLYAGNAVIHLRAQDEIYKDRLEKAVGREISFETDETILLGGVKISFTDAAVMADDTLDARFEEQKKAFVRNSGLGFKE